MQKEIDQIRLGEFVLDLQQRILYRDTVEIAAEPKVMELLVYLYLQRDRYVPLEELHQQVWSDRVVSDTAVRSAVKKLRLLLNDDVANPTYLKSASKRGYKLVCAIAPLQQSSVPAASQLPAQPVSEDLLEALGGYALSPASSVDLATKHRKTRSCFLLFAFLLSAVWSLWFTFSWESIDAVQLPEIKQLTDFQGEKITLTVSSCGRYIAFTGRISAEQDAQVFLYDQQTNSTRQLTTKATNAVFVSFVHNDKALVYSNSISDISSLHLLPLTVAEPESAAVTLLSDKYLIGQLEKGRHSAEVLLVMMERAGAAAMVYALDTSTTVLQRLVTVSQPNTHIYGLALSPDRHNLALFRQTNSNNQLVIHDLETKNEQKILDLSSQIDGMVWHQDNQLVVLGDDSVRLLDIVTKTEKLLLANTDKLISAMASHDGKQLLLVKKAKTRADRLYVEQALSVEVVNNNVIDSEPSIIAMAYGENDQHKWVTLLKNDVYSVARQHKGEQKPEIIYQSNKELELLDVAETRQQLLLKEGNRLLMVSFLDGTARYLTTPSEIVSDAVFSKDAMAVLYGIRIGGQWDIQQYDLSRSMTSVLLHGYKSVRPAEPGYVVADEQGFLFYLASLEQQPTALNQQIGFEFITRWYVRQNKVVWTTFDYRHTSLHQLELVSGNYQLLQRPYLSLYPRISVSPAADKVLFLSVKLNDASLNTMSVISE